MSSSSSHPGVDLGEQASRPVLIHGLWMRPLVMRLLGARLGGAHYFHYRTTSAPIERRAEDLAQFVRTVACPPYRLVGHSLGGLVALAAAQHLEGGGRIVALGSPFLGSVAAQRLSRVPFARRLLGAHKEHWSAEEHLPIPNGWSVGVIAGSFPLGLGQLVGGVAAPHDGAVSVAETRLPGALAHTVLPVSHTALVYSADAARMTNQFLAHGTF